MTMMGVTEAIAADVETYIDIAARLVLDPAWRRAVAARIRNNRHKVLADMGEHRGLERFLVATAGQRFDRHPPQGRQD